MAPVTLVGPDIERGEALYKEIDRAGVSVFAAFWLFASDTGRWRLVVATPEWDTLGPLEAYGRVQLALSRVPELNLPLWDIVLVRPADKLVEDLRAALPGGVTIRPYSGQVAFRGSPEDEGGIGTVYVYKLLPAPRRMGMSP